MRKHKIILNEFTGSKIKRKNLITDIKLDDIVTIISSGEIVKVTEIYQTYIKGKVIENFQPIDNFDTGERQLDNSSYKK